MFERRSRVSPVTLEMLSRSGMMDFLSVIVPINTDIFLSRVKKYEIADFHLLLVRLVAVVRFEAHGRTYHEFRAIT